MRFGGDIEVRRLGFGASHERTGPSGQSAMGKLIGWTPHGRPDHLRTACEASLRRLRLDRIELYQLHTPDPAVPYAKSIDALNALRSEGEIRHIGVALQLDQDEIDAITAAASRARQQTTRAT